jgi:DnaJ homologue, subfamily C, member 28, conserved domain
MSNQRPYLTDRAIRIIAENKIVAAIEAGEFDKLPGFGRPAAIFDEPYDPHWWIRRKLRREQLTSLVNYSTASA